jgi:predicted glycoside hydrolase/deacetylase ChbG (UPF0249 family)
MVTGEAFEEAVRLARENPGLAVGIHLVTVSGRSALPPSEIPALVDSSGYFSNSARAAGLKYFFSKQARSQLRQELAAQFERFLTTGLPCSHIDGHLHMHVHPVILKAAIVLGIHNKVKRMRVPHDDLKLGIQFDRSSPSQESDPCRYFWPPLAFHENQTQTQRLPVPERVYGCSKLAE